MSNPGINRAKRILKAYDWPEGQVVQLARAVCLAVRVEPALIRAARIAMTPNIDAGAESDLWFSRLVSSRSIQGIVLDSDILGILRKDLASRPDELENAWKILSQVRKRQPSSPLIDLEEFLIFTSLCDVRGASSLIDERLRQVIKAFVSDENRAVDIARWVKRAANNLPAAARSSDNFRLLYAAAMQRLGPSKAGTAALPKGGMWLLERSGAHGSSSRSDGQIGITLRYGQLDFSSTSEAAHVINLPGNVSPLVEIEWGDQIESRRTLVARPGTSVPMPIWQHSLIIKVADGRAYLLAVQDMSEAEYERAIRIRSEKLEASPDDMTLLARRGSDYWYIGRFDLAIADFNRVINAIGEDPAILSARGQALASAGRPELAIRDLDKAIAAMEDDAAFPRRGRAEALLAQGNYVAAMSEIQISLKEAPDNAWAYFTRASILDAVGERESAEAHYREALVKRYPPLNPYLRKRALAQLQDQSRGFIA